ncbi:unnamed protein product, partial [Ascophyllum nodosum]
ASGAVAHNKVRTEPRLTDTNVVTVKGKGKGETTEGGPASCGVDGRRRDRTTPHAQAGPSPWSLNEVGEEMSWASKIAAVIRESLKRAGDGRVLPNSANFERAQDETCPSTAQGIVSSPGRASRNETVPNLRSARSPRKKRPEGEHDLDNGTDEREHFPRDQISSKIGESAVSCRRSPTKVSPQRISAERTRRNLRGGAS